MRDSGIAGGALVEEGISTRFNGFRGTTLGRLLRIKLTVVGMAFILLVVFSALLAPVLTPYGPNEILTFKTETPSLAHPLGTDPLGRDQLTRLLYGARVSIIVSVFAAGFGILVGGSLGLIAAYFRGFVDSVLMRLVDGMMSLPGLVLPLTLMALLGGGVQTIAIILGIGFSPGVARLVRGQALSQLERDYVLAARAMGANRWRVMFRHAAPNCMAPVIVAASLGMSAAVTAEAALSFLGAGITPPTATWGTMLSTGFTYLRIAPWIVFAPGAAIFLLVLAYNFVGDGLRDVLDPRLRGSI